MTAWLRAFRLRTLPLAFSSIILGSLMAYHFGAFRTEIFIAAILTTLFLQVLSNLANDYGDFVNGVDNDNRVGPSRTLQSGEITPNAMQKAIFICGFLAFASGLWLLYEGLDTLGLQNILFLFLLGIGAIAAAVNYTMGSKPYGYRGLGDVAVFLFFGLAGVAGTFYLHTGQLSWIEFLPAASIGLLSTGVLNLNNMRDELNDKATGKNSLVVMMGSQRAKAYHAALISLAVVCSVVYAGLSYSSAYQFSFLIAVPLLLRNVRAVLRNQDRSQLDPELKKLALATLLFAVSLGFGLIFS